MRRQGKGQPQDRWSLVPVGGIFPLCLAVWNAADWLIDLKESAALYDERSPGPVGGSPTDEEHGATPSSEPHLAPGVTEGVMSARRAG